MNRRHDVLVIGAGSAGYAAARTAHALGADVGLCDPGPLGGLCILRGCMPTKALLRAAEVAALMRRAPEFGVAAGPPRIDFAAVMARKDRLVAEFAAERIAALRDGRFRLYEQPAVFVSPAAVRAGKDRIEADRFVIATGSVPAATAVPGLDAAGYLTSDAALALRQLPASMVVLGGGPVALELAQFFQRLGTRVALIQRRAHVLSRTDEDIARPLESRLRAEGMEVFTETRLLSVSATEGGRCVRFLHRGEQRAVRGQVILQALGRRPAVDGLGLERAGVALAGGSVVVDAELRSSQPHIYAVGDVNGVQQAVHSAVLQGEIAAHNAVRRDRPARRLDRRLTLEVTFTDPQVAGVGLTERECRSRGIAYRVAAHPFSEHGRSLCMGDTDGHAKLLCEPATGRILGGHVVGPGAGEIIHELAVAMRYGGTVQQLAETPHYHPTLAEILTYPAEELASQIA